MKQLFAITNPLSCYLQTKSIDFIQEYQLVDIAKKELEKMRSTEKFQELVKTLNYLQLKITLITLVSKKLEFVKRKH